MTNTREIQRCLRRLEKDGRISTDETVEYHEAINTVEELDIIFRETYADVFNLPEELLPKDETSNDYIQDIKLVKNWLNDRHPHLAIVTLVVFNLCALVAIPLMLVGILITALYRILSLPFRKGARKDES